MSNNNNNTKEIGTYESSKLTIDTNLFRLGLKMKDDNNNTWILVHIKERREYDNQHDYCLTFRKVMKQECSSCGYVDVATISPYCSKCYVSYNIVDLHEYGLHV